MLFLAMHSALVIIDMQQDFFKKDELTVQKDFLIKNINQLVAHFRDKSLPIIWLRQTMKADLSDAPLGPKNTGTAFVVEGTPGSQLLPGLDFLSSDIEIIKKRYSGFYQTNLEDTLKSLSVDTLVVSGINSHACVRVTVVDAYQRDFDVIVAQDCVASWDPPHHAITMKYFVPTIAKVMTNSEILSL